VYNLISKYVTAHSFPDCLDSGAVGLKVPSELTPAAVWWWGFTEVWGRCGLGQGARRRGPPHCCRSLLLAFPKSTCRR